MGRRAHHARRGAHRSWFAHINGLRQRHRSSYLALDINGKINLASASNYNSIKKKKKHRVGACAHNLRAALALV